MPELSSSPVIAEGLPITFRDQTIWHDPADFERSVMLNLDFDETCFTTFISKSDGVEVREAYEIAIQSVLGLDAHRDYKATGGLSNRAPLDVIEGIVKANPRIVYTALDHAREHFQNPADITDIGFGLIARFAKRGQTITDELTMRAITEMLVVRKKEKLMPQISAEWPLPVKGFDEFWLEAHDKKASGEWPFLQTSIVSSGHTDFIQKVLETVGLPHPDVYMTDDEMRRQVHPRTKPHPFALKLVENAWLNAYLISDRDKNDPVFMDATRTRELYFGDDVSKDGEMASNHDIRFEHHDGDANRFHYLGKVVDGMLKAAA